MLLPLLAFGLGQAAAAAPIFQDDFESGALTGTGGKWTFTYADCAAPACSVTATSAAARRGSFGFRMKDDEANSGGRTEGIVSKSLPTGSTYYVRFWLRVTPRQTGGLTLDQLCASSGCGESFTNVYFDDARNVGHAGLNGASSSSSTSSIQLASGVWYLIEQAATGIGSSTGGRRRMWINGTLAADTSGLNFSGWSVTKLDIGQAWSDAPGGTSGTFRGDLDYDDLYVDDTPLPSRFSVEAPSSITTGECTAVTVSLRDSVSNALADAPYNVSGVSLSTSGTASATFYTNSACTTATGTLSIGVDTSSRVYYVKATTAGSLTLRAGTTSDDFRPGQATLDVALATSPNGASCTQNSQCTSGFCVDGVCCNSACNAGSCDACSVSAGASSNGTCTIRAAGTVCRSAYNTCDKAEVCNGSSGACPADTFLPSGTVCRAGTDVCDRTETCTGTSASCPPDNLQASGTVCRAANGACDRAESCTGSSAACPANAVAPGGTVCREAAGICDNQELCSGTSADCPADAFRIAGTVCRNATDVCDEAETCSGSSAACPGDALAPRTVMCSAATATHQASYCSGADASCPVPTLREQTGQPLESAPPVTDSPTTTHPPGTGTQAPETGAPEAPGADQEPSACQGTGCIEQANLGFSCAATGQAGLGLLLPGLVLLFRSRRRRRASSAQRCADSHLCASGARAAEGP